jgi:Amt family ammonium transporter
MLDDTGATLAPDKFLSAAERYQLMPAIDRWVIVEALATVARHVQLAGHGDWRFYINVSGQSLGDSEFLTFVQDAVERSGAPPECLVFEITETAAVAKLERARQFIVSLSRIGCRFALDDFGTGLSSFAYLQSLPVHVLKIDGTFVRRLAGSRVSASMVAAIAQVARVMELETIAESVESAAVLQRVEGLGVSYAQGFHLGRPAPLEETMEAAAASETAGTSPAPRDEVRQALP